MALLTCPNLKHGQTTSTCSRRWRTMLCCSVSMSLMNLVSKIRSEMEVTKLRASVHIVEIASPVSLAFSNRGDQDFELRIGTTSSIYDLFVAQEITEVGCDLVISSSAVGLGQQGSDIGGLFDSVDASACPPEVRFPVYLQRQIIRSWHGYIA